MRKIKIILFMLVILLLPSAVYAKEVNIKFFGEEVVTDVKPIIQNDRVMVPFSALSEYLGSFYRWYSDTKSIDIYQNDISKYVCFTLKIGSKDIKVKKIQGKINDYDIIKSDVAPMIKNNRTYIPLRTVAEIFGEEVNWDSATMTVNVGKSKKSSENTRKVLFNNHYITYIKNEPDPMNTLISVKDFVRGENRILERIYHRLDELYPDVDLTEELLIFYDRYTYRLVDDSVVLHSHEEDLCYNFKTGKMIYWLDDGPDNVNPKPRFINNEVYMPIKYLVYAMGLDMEIKDNGDINFIDYFEYKVNEEDFDIYDVREPKGELRKLTTDEIIEIVKNL